MTVASQPGHNDFQPFPPSSSPPPFFFRRVVCTHFSTHSAPFVARLRLSLAPNLLSIVGNRRSTRSLSQPAPASLLFDPLLRLYYFLQRFSIIGQERNLGKPAMIPRAYIIQAGDQAGRRSTGEVSI